MNRRVQRVRLLGIVRRTPHYHGVIAHRSADESLLSGKCRRSSFPHDDELLAEVLLHPREVVVIVNQLDLVRPDYLDDFSRNPLTTSIGILAGKIHQRPVVLANRRIEIEKCLRLLRALAPFPVGGQREKSRRDRMAKTTRSEVNTNPYAAVGAVGENIDVMVAASNRAELCASLRQQLRNPGLAWQQAPCMGFEELVIDGSIVCPVRPPHSE